MEHFGIVHQSHVWKDSRELVKLILLFRFFSSTIVNIDIFILFSFLLLKQTDFDCLVQLHLQVSLFQNLIHHNTLYPHAIPMHTIITFIFNTIIYIHLMLSGNALHCM